MWTDECSSGLDPTRILEVRTDETDESAQFLVRVGAFPTGPAVLVAADFEMPEDRVASTGAYIPSNGKPTLVFVDAIW